MQERRCAVDGTYFFTKCLTGDDQQSAAFRNKSVNYFFRYKSENEIKSNREIFFPFQESGTPDLFKKLS